MEAQQKRRFAAFTDVEMRAVKQIIDRAGVAFPPFRAPGRTTLLMDLSAVHAQYGLDVTRLAEADDADFMHDVSGIACHMNRESARLENCFVPRFAKRAGGDR